MYKLDLNKKYTRKDRHLRGIQNLVLLFPDRNIHIDTIVELTPVESDKDSDRDVRCKILTKETIWNEQRTVRDIFFHFIPSFDIICADLLVETAEGGLTVNRSFFEGDFFELDLDGLSKIPYEMNHSRFRKKWSPWVISAYDKDFTKPRTFYLVEYKTPMSIFNKTYGTNFTCDRQGFINLHRHYCQDPSNYKKIYDYHNRSKGLGVDSGSILREQFKSRILDLKFAALFQDAINERWNYGVLGHEKKEKARKIVHAKKKVRRGDRAQYPVAYNNLYFYDEDTLPYKRIYMKIFSIFRDMVRSLCDTYNVKLCGIAEYMLDFERRLHFNEPVCKGDICTSWS